MGMLVSGSRWYWNIIVGGENVKGINPLYIGDPRDKGFI